MIQVYNAPLSKGQLTIDRTAGRASPLLITMPGSQNEESFFIFLNESFHPGKRSDARLLGAASLWGLLYQRVRVLTFSSNF